MRPLGCDLPRRLEAEPVDHTEILTCGVYKSRLTRYTRLKSDCTCGSYGDPYVWVLPFIRFSQGNEDQGSITSAHI
ncbi:hypothetical protein MTR_6g015945 [Medicago truncatula]|uniref:Uncharacterized protein n=1 Tax=Medicago truncatula TaxID=3880 RepID=A0A072UH70_MEDTR|nr:hypothetical protein MTR_6g015945 [Medicago truncatula]